MKRLKQIEETRKLIAEALLKLLKTDSLEDITISQIAGEAGAGRNTLYSHFKNKEEILLYLMDSLLQSAQEELLKKPNPSFKDFLYWRFSLLKKNPLLHTLQKEEAVRVILYHFRNSHNSLLNMKVADDEYTREFILGGIDSITLQWIRKGLKESPQEMADKILSIITPKDSVTTGV